MPPRVEEERCMGCGVCIRVCPTLALRLVAHEVSSSELRRFLCEVHEPERCTGCGKCIDECPSRALGLVGG